MSKLIAIRIISNKGTTPAGTVEPGAGTKGAALRIKAAEGAIELQDTARNNQGPQGLRTKRLGRDLLLAFEGGDINKPDVVLEDFYANANACRLIGKNADGGMSEYAPSSGNANDRISSLAADASSAQVLGKEFCSIVPAMLEAGTPAAAAAPTAATTVNPMVWGAVGLGVLGLAAAAGGGGGGGSSGPGSIAPPPATLADASDSGAKGDSRTNDNTPTISGTGVAGQTIVVTGPAGLTMTTTVAANGTWSVTPTSPLAEGANAFSVVARDAAGNTSTPTALTITVDSVAPTTSPGSTSGLENAASIAVDLTATDGSAGTGLQSIAVTTLPPATEGTLYLSGGTTAVTAGQALTAAQAAALVFVPAANFNGTVNIAYTATDVVGNVSAVANETITVTPVNSAPTIARSNSDPLAIGEGGTIGLNNRGFSIDDADAGTNPVRLTVASNDPADAIEVNVGTTGVVVVSGNTSSSVVLEGTIAQLNALLASSGGNGWIEFTDVVAMTDDGAASATVTMTVNDQGNTGGAALTGTRDTTITINATDELFVGTAGNNIRNGGVGNDTLYGAGGDDTLAGGAGNDVLVGGAGSIVNSSFEHWTSLADTVGGTYPNWYSVSQVRGWNILTSLTELNSYNTDDLVSNPQAIRSTANSQDGRYAIDVAGAGISQTVATQANTSYVLTFELTDRSTDGAVGDVLVTIDGVLVATITTAGVMTLAGSAVNGSVSNIANAQGVAPHGNYGNDRQYQFTFTSDADGATNIAFSSPITPVSNGRALDDIRLTPLTGDGNDVLIGGSGTDRLWGMGGSNVLTGGTGADEFHVSRSVAGTDLITDFEVGVDKLVINDLFDLTATNTQHPGTVANSNTLLGLDDLINVGGTDQTITWNDATKTLTFGWGGSVTFQGMTASYASAADFLAANAILRMESFGGGA